MDAGVDQSLAGMTCGNKVFKPVIVKSFTNTGFKWYSGW
jgi:hypothetical protein